MQTNSRIGPYVVAAVGLLALTLGLFAIVWPFNGADFDDWSNIYVSREQMLNQDSTDRAFILGSAALAQTILPNRMGNLFTGFVFFTFAVSVGIFHIIYRLSEERYPTVAFLTAAVYLVYIPYNLDQARILIVSPFPWVILLGVASAVMLTEFFLREDDRLKIPLLIGSAILGYMAVRAFEALILPVGAMPILLFVLMRQNFSRRMIVAAGLWMLIVGVGALQFAVPYVSGTGDSFYQADYQLEEVTPGYLIQNSIEFYEASFPVQDQILQTEFTYVAPGIMIALIFAGCGLLLWSQSARAVPSIGYLLAMFGTGVILTGLGGGAAIYADIHLIPRSHFAASVGQSLAVAAVLLGVVRLLGWQLRVRLPVLLLIVSTTFIFTASQWYLKAQVRADAHGLDLTVNNDLWRDMVALIPQTEPDTLILYHCPEPTNPAHFIRGSSIAAPWLFYDRSRTEVAFAEFHVGASDTQQPVLAFNEEHVDFEIYRYGESDFDSVGYGYDQIIAVGCQQDRLVILEDFPPSLAPRNARTDLYNPHARIIDSFIQPSQATLITR